MVDAVSYFVPGVEAVEPLRQELVVVRLGVPDVRHDGYSHCFVIETLGRGAASHAAAVFAAGMVRDRLFAARRALGKQGPHPFGEGADVFTIELVARDRLALATPLAGRLVVETVAFGLCEGLFFHQDSLPLVAFTGRAPLENDGGKLRVLASSPASAASPDRKKAR